MTTLVYCSILAGLSLIAVAAVWRYPGWASCLLSVLALVFSAGAVAWQTAPFFTAAKLAAYGWFIHVPLLLVFCAAVTRKTSRRLAITCVTVASLLAGTAFYAFQIEPYWLEITYVDLESNKVDRRVRIAIIADLQTDTIGRYERESLARVLELEPDLILLAGDYFQPRQAEQWKPLCDELNEYLKEIDFGAPMGVYAVAGNTDRYHPWTRIFEGLPAGMFRRTESVELDQLQITGLSVGASFGTRTRVEPADKFHLVLGHCPNFALGEIHADLLVAGHTHGGQVRLPWIGPLVTFSKVPRSWAAGVTEIDAGRYLIVSRGVGMERTDAPRLRFLCRPEVVVVDLTPASQAASVKPVVAAKRAVPLVPGPEPEAD